MLPLILLTLTIFPTGCGTRGFSDCPAPVIPHYDREFSIRLADQIDRACIDDAAKNRELCRALQDCFVTRRQIKACEQ